MILSGSNSTFKIFYLIKIRKHTYLTCSINIDIWVVCQGKCPCCLSIKIFAELRNCNLAITGIFLFKCLSCTHKTINNVLILTKMINLSIYLDLLRKKLQRGFLIHNGRIHDFWFSFHHPWYVVFSIGFKAKHLFANN